ncbi:oxidoreductase [Flavobacterium suaedae]|uniref:Oxidoreductase n=1 Tax=Flavobacterium suaedae TaxID=1767027 RepID=A0ABQ1JVV5_9FLAO|nr:SDR family oxidoreductase [Flavobacterium suaedae]GGB78654.1 oxidoreductase [Flavobacterium suaedae]
MDLQLKNKTALITGSTEGIGYAIAKGLLAEGATVYINGRKQKTIDESVKKLKEEVSSADAHGIAADFSKVEEIDNLIQQLPEVDILINNVGVFGPKPFEEITDEDWFNFFEINVMSGVRLSRHYLPKMKEKNWGRILFTSSESGVNIPEDMIHYGFTKTALLSISRGLAQLCKATNVTVNAVLPGPTMSEGVKEMTGIDEGKDPDEVAKDFFENERPTSIIQRFASPEEVANLFVYLSSPLSAATNGAPMRVDGGVIRSAF